MHFCLVRTISCVAAKVFGYRTFVASLSVLNFVFNRCRDANVGGRINNSEGIEHACGTIMFFVRAERTGMISARDD